MEAVAWGALGLLGAALAALVGALFHLGSKIDGQGASIGSKIDGQGASLGSRIDAQSSSLGAKIDAQAARIDALIKQVSEHIAHHTG